MENKELLSVMEKCGHFLYHRRGGKRGQLNILKIISENGIITQKKLSELLSLKSSSVSETVGKLEAQGFILGTRDETDKRKINLSLTDAGNEFLAAALDIQRQQEKILFTSLSCEEQACLKELLCKLFADWEDKFSKDLFNHKNRSDINV